MIFMRVAAACVVHICLSWLVGWLAKHDHKGSPRAQTNHVVVLVNFVVN